MMKVRNGLAVALVGALLAGTLLAFATTEAQEAATAASVSVPPGRVGDRVEYAFHSRTAGDADGLTGDEPWTYVGLESFEIAERTTVVDRDGIPRDAIRIVANVSSTPSLLLELDMRGGTLSSSGFTFYDVVDIETRESVSLTLNRNVGGAQHAGDLAVTFLNARDPDFDGLHFSGRTVTTGDDVTGWLEPAHPPVLLIALVASFGFPFGAGGGVSTVGVEPHDLEIFDPARWQDLEFDAAAGGGATVAGRDTVAVGSVLKVPSSGGARDSEPAVEIRRTDWLASDVPYPVATRLSVYSDPTDGPKRLVSESMRSLHEYRAGGGGEIPWGGPEPDPALAPRRAPGAAPLTQGDSAAVYPLDQAVADVKGDVTLVQFQMWRQANPDHRLVGAYYHPSQERVAGDAAAVWELTFAEPGDSEAYEVRTQRRVGASQPVTENGGTPTIDGFEADDMPRDAWTRGSAERAWQAAASEEYAGLAPNHVRWGMYIQGGSSAGAPAYCVSPVVGGPQSVPDEAGPFDTLLVGWTSGTDCTDPNAAAWRESGMFVDLSEGSSLWFGYEVRRQFDSPVPQLEAAPEPAAGTSHAAVRDPGVPSIDTWSISVAAALAAALLAYFFPVVRFTVTKGLFLVPGFARISREKLLDNEARDQMMAQLEAEPGLTATDLKNRLALGWGTVVYHLTVLEKGDLVSTVVDGRSRRFFPAGRIDYSKQGQVALLKHERTRHFYELVLESPGSITRDLAARADVSDATASWHLKRLEEAGLVGRVKEGRKLRHYANEAGRILKTANPGEDDAVEVA